MSKQNKSFYERTHKSEGNLVNVMMLFIDLQQCRAEVLLWRGRPSDLRVEDGVSAGGGALHHLGTGAGHHKERCDCKGTEIQGDPPWTFFASKISLQICNKGEKKFCCETDQRNSGTYLPR